MSERESTSSLPVRSDALEREWERLWYEIRRLMPRCQALIRRGEGRGAAEERELRELLGTIADLRTRTRRYREVLRSEAMSEAGRG